MTIKRMTKQYISILKINMTEEEVLSLLYKYIKIYKNINIL